VLSGSGIDRERCDEHDGCQRHSGNGERLLHS
jgi:hypothetical protein